MRARRQNKVSKSTITIYLSTSLLQKLDERAQENDVSRNELITDILKGYFKAERGKNEEVSTKQAESETIILDEDRWQ